MIKNILSVIFLTSLFLIGIIYVKPYRIMTQSMQDVINPGDVVVTIKSLQRMGLKNGDIVAFQKRNNKTTFVKRIYASGGDTLKLLRNYIKVGDKNIPHDSIFEMMVEESDHPDSLGIFSTTNYLNYIVRNLPKKDQLKSRLETGNGLIVPEDYFFMVGDNYYESMDSRFWGFISKENIKGKVIWIF